MEPTSSLSPQTFKRRLKTQALWQERKKQDYRRESLYPRV